MKARLIKPTGAKKRKLQIRKKYVKSQILLFQERDSILKEEIEQNLLRIEKFKKQFEKLKEEEQ